MKHPNWNKIFDEPVLFAKRAGGGKTNEVWRIRTERGAFIVKITRTSPHPKKGFWYGLDVLFGLDIYRDLKHLPEVEEFITSNSPLAVPRIVRVDTSRELHPKPYVIYEYMPGEPANFQEEGDTRQLLYDLGNHLGSMDKASFDYWGCFPESPRLEPKEWPSCLMRTLRKIADRRFPGNAEIQNAVNEAEEKINQMALPSCFTMIMLDLHGEQFLTEDRKLKALVDIESHVIAPRELAWISLEYEMKPEDAASFLDGYQQHLPAPKLDEVREIYRILSFLMFTQVGSFRDWMDQPAIFE